MSSSKKSLSRRQFVGSVAALSSAAILSSCGGSGSSGIVSDVSLNPAGGAPNPARRQSLALPKRTLGRTGLQVTTLSFGGGSAFMSLPEGTWQTVIQHAYDMGINFFDNANEYNAGASESRFGTFFSASGRRQNVLLSTKLNLYATGTTRNYAMTKAAVQADLDASLTRMKTDYLDFLFLHAISSGDDIDKIGTGIWQHFKDFKAAGKARFIGCTGMGSGAKQQEFINKLDPDVVIMALSITGYKAYSTLALPAAIAKNAGVMAIKLCKGIVDATPPLATPLECFSYGLCTLNGVSSLIIGPQGGVSELNQNATLITNLGNCRTEIIHGAELEKRMAPYANENHLCWAHPDYRDDGTMYELRDSQLVRADTGESVVRIA